MRLSETLVGLALMAVLSTGVVSVVASTSRLAGQHADRFEAQQRVRVALDLVTRDLRSAGAGVDRGPATGPLVASFPAVWPRRLGVGGHAPTVALPTAITIVFVPDTLAQTVTAGPVWPGSSHLVVEPAPHCPPWRPACGFTSGTPVVVFQPPDGPTFWTTAAVTDLTLSGRAFAASETTLAAGSVVSEVRVRGYLLDGASRQLRYFDGESSPQTLIDGVTAWSVRYFAADGELPPARLSDGPWRGSGSTMFDEDLLRVRRVGIHLAVRVGAEQFGAAVDVTPHNLRAGGGAP